MKASTTTALDNPTVSASGASIGIDNTAKPDVDGIKIPKNAIDKIFLASFGTHYVLIKLHPNVIAKLRLIISEEK